MSEGKFRPYRRTGAILARPYEPGEDLSHVSVSDEDDPSEGDMIARNPENPRDMWLIDREYFDNHYRRLRPSEELGCWP